MNSVSKALLRELLVRGRWQIPLWFIGGNVMPFLLYSAFGKYEMDLADPALVMMHVMITPLAMLLFSLGVISSQGTLNRLYLAPMSTASIVAWHMFPGAILLSLQMAASLAWQNAWFGSQHPILGPTLFAAAAWASAQMLAGVSHRTLTSLVLSSIPVVWSFCWFGSRHGGWMKSPEHYWTDVTVSDIFMMIGIIVISYILTVRVISSERCGEQFQSLSLWKWIEHTWERISTMRSGDLRPFGSARQAQLWYEWRSKGIALPIATGIIIAFGTAVILVRMVALGNVSETLKESQEAVVGAGFVLPMVAGLSGLLLGTTFSGIQGRDHKSTIRDLNVEGQFDRMGNFLATRPMTNTTYAGIILRTAVKSTALSWCLWAVVLTLAAVLGMLAGVTSEPFAKIAGKFWYLCGTLFAIWIAITAVASTVLTGRFPVFAVTFTIGIFVAVFLMLLTENYATQQLKSQLSLLVPLGIAIVALAGTAVAFIAASRRSVVTGTLAWRCGIAWLLLNSVALMLKPTGLTFVAYPLLLAFTALVILPFATTPLAITWNRHR